MCFWSHTLCAANKLHEALDYVALNLDSVIHPLELLNLPQPWKMAASMHIEDLKSNTHGSLE